MKPDINMKTFMERESRLASRRAVHNAVRRGDVVQAERCEDCGSDFSDYRRHAHHDDYSAPLEVTWLCSRCHAGRHGLGPPRETNAHRKPSVSRYQEARELALQQFEKSYIDALLTQTAGNVFEAARESGMDRATIYRLLGRHGINPNDYRPRHTRRVRHG
jgi:DNA-binding NtrC family response regulator